MLLSRSTNKYLILHNSELEVVEEHVTDSEEVNDGPLLFQGDEEVENEGEENDDDDDD